MTVYHPVGTCKMGHVDDPSTVVDSRGRVKGLARLRVADASVMPSIVRYGTARAAGASVGLGPSHALRAWVGLGRGRTGVRSGNTNAAAIMIGERIAALIRQDWAQ